MPSAGQPPAVVMLRTVVARLPGPCVLVGLALVLTSWWHHDGWLSGLGTILILAGVLIPSLPARRVEREPFEVTIPVRGRWLAVNSPANKVPSHGVHTAGQTHAIDLVYWPDDARTWADLRNWPLTQRADAFPAFGQPIFAPADGTVVSTRSWWRDHRSRDSWAAVVYFLFVEGFVRQLAGPSALLGNNVVLDLGGGTFAALAHLRRKSITVEKGQRVHVGQQLAECGNSGNSTEPHLHLQLMDRADVATAAGLPFSLAGREIPKNREAFTSPVD